MLGFIDVPRNAWDPTEGFHSRHGERTFDDIDIVEVHWPGADADFADEGDTGEELLSFERFHEVSKKWYDLFYNVGGDTEGFTYEGRDHTIPSQSNLRNVLTYLAVVGTNDELFQEQIDALASGIFRAWTAVDPDRKPSTLRTHQERPGASTSCPGFVQEIVDRLRSGWIPQGVTMSEVEIDHKIPDVVREDVDYALEEGIASRDEKTGDIILPGNFTPTWRVVTFIARAHRSLSERIDAIKPVEGPRGPKGPKGDPGPKGDSADIPMADLQAAIRREMPAIIRAVKDDLSRDLAD